MVEMSFAQKITMVPKKIDKFRTKVYLLSKTLVLDFSGFFSFRQNHGKLKALDTPEKRY